MGLGIISKKPRIYSILRYFREFRFNAFLRMGNSLSKCKNVYSERNNLDQYLMTTHYARNMKTVNYLTEGVLCVRYVSQ